MIFAIVNQTVPSGVVKVASFVEAIDAAAAITQFVAAPPAGKVPGDWLAYNTGWTTFQYPAIGFHWEYDFDGAPAGLVQVANPKTPMGPVASTVLTPLPVVLTPVWTVLGGTILAPDVWGINLNIALARVRAQYTSDATGGVPEIRLRQNAVVIAQKGLPTQALFTEVSIENDPNVNPLIAGPNAYIFEGRLNGGLAATLRFATLFLVPQKT